MSLSRDRVWKVLKIKLFQMKILIEKEKDWLYFAKIDWMDDVYAQWETLEEVLDNLWSVYEEVMKLKKEILKNKYLKANKSLSKLELTI